MQFEIQWHTSLVSNFIASLLASFTIASTSLEVDVVVVVDVSCTAFMNFAAYSSNCIKHSGSTIFMLDFRRTNCCKFADVMFISIFFHYDIEQK